MNFNLTILQDTFAICRLPPDAPIPTWTSRGPLVSVTRTPDELSLVCLQASVPEGVHCERDWRCLRIEGPLDFALVGVLVSLLSPLAEAGISIFAVSTFDTDYLLVRQPDLSRALEALRQNGHRITG
jgi:hypothetical protein